MPRSENRYAASALRSALLSTPPTSKREKSSRAVAPVDRQERAVAAASCEIQHRRALVLEALEVREADVTVAVRRLAEHRQAVASDDLDGRARYRRAGRDRLHEHVVRAVDRAFRDQTEIGDDEQASRPHSAAGAALFQLLAVLARGGLVAVPRLHAHQEDAAPVAALRRSRNSPRSTASYCALPGGAGGSCSTRTKRSATFAASNDQLENIGIAKLPCDLRDEVLQLARQQRGSTSTRIARTLRANRLQRLLAGHRQQRALVQDAQLARKFRHADDALDGVAELVAAERAQARHRSSRRRSGPDRPRSAGCAARSVRARRESA